MATCSGDMGPVPFHRDQAYCFIIAPLTANKNVFNAGQVTVDLSLKMGKEPWPVRLG